MFYYSETLCETIIGYLHKNVTNLCMQLAPKVKSVLLDLALTLTEVIEFIDVCICSYLISLNGHANMNKMPIVWLADEGDRRC